MNQTLADTDDTRLQDFDAQWYLETYTDVGPSGLSPERHYLLCGVYMERAKNASEMARRKPAGLLRQPVDVAALFGRDDTAETPPQPGPVDSPIISAPQDINKYPPKRLQAPPRALAPGLTMLVSGEAALGFDVDAQALAHQCAPVRSLLALLRSPDRAAPALALRGMDTPDRILDLPGALPGMAQMVSPLFLEGPHKITDAWFATTATLRLAVQGNDILEGVTDSLGVLRAWQPDPRSPGALIALDEVALPEVGPGFVELALDNPLMPLLLELAGSSGTTRGFALLPYPSLLRGGLHSAERAANQLSLMPMDDIWRLSLALLREQIAGAAQGGFSVARLAVRLDGATGAEAVFSPQVRDWLSGLFGLDLHAAQGVDEAAQDQGTAWLRQSLSGDLPDRGTGLTLTLPAQAVPSLQSLVTRRLHLPDGMATAPGPWLVSEAVQARPLWSVAMPATAPASPDMPMLDKNTQEAGADAQTPFHWMAPLHLAVVLRPADPPGETRALFPAAPDAAIPPQGVPADLSVVLTVSDPAEAEAAMIALGAQTDLPQITLILRGRCDSTADGLDQIRAKANQLFGTPPQQMPAQTGTLDDLDTILAATQTEHIVLMDAAVILHHEHILATLAAELNADTRRASMSCSLFHSHIRGNKTALDFASGGMFAAQISLLGAPRLTVSEPDTRLALPASSYPVLANTFDLCALRRSALQDTAAARAAMPGTGAADLHFGLSARAAGWQHICTSRISAGMARAPSRRDEMDPFGLACILPARWEDLLSQVTVLRELRG
jgi:hypothetical protein